MGGAKRALQSVKGAHDLTPPASAIFDNVIKTMTDIATQYGCARIDTPIFEFTDLFERSVGGASDIVHKQMYTFDDKSGDSLTLRPEGTAGICRAYIERGMSNLPQPVRLHYAGAMFRYERPQKGRKRQFSQFGVEIIGKASPTIDAELIELAWRCVTAVFKEPTEVVLNWIGDAEERGEYVERLRNYYKQHEDELDDAARERLGRSPLRMMEADDPVSRRLAQSAPKSYEFLSPSSRERFTQLRGLLDLLKKVHSGFEYRVEHTLVRGLDYYSGAVFEIVPRAAGGAQSTLGGGGRYDGLMETLGGPQTPAAGFALGIDRIINGIGDGFERPATVDYAVALFGTVDRGIGFEVASRLRAKLSAATVVIVDGGSPSACLKQASRLGAKVALLIGQQEADNSAVTVKDMATGEQKKAQRFDAFLERL